MVVLEHRFVESENKIKEKMETSTKGFPLRNKTKDGKKYSVDDFVALYGSYGSKQNGREVLD